jgi:hypothetical protein
MDTSRIKGTTKTIGFNPVTGITTEYIGSYTGNGQGSVLKRFDINDYISNLREPSLDILTRRNNILKSGYSDNISVAKAKNPATAGSEILGISTELEYKVFLDVLEEAGLEVLTDRSQISLFQMLQDEEGNPDLGISRKIYTALLEQYEVIKSDKKELLFSPAFGLIIEALNSIFINSTKKRNSRKRTAQVLDILISPNLNFTIIQEYIPGTDLFTMMQWADQITDRDDKLQWLKDALGVVLDVADSLERNPVYGDIKPSNMLLSEEHRGVLIDLSDFVLINESKLVSPEVLSSLTENHPISSFPFTLSCLDVIDFIKPSASKRELVRRVLFNTNEEERLRFIDRMMVEIRANYMYFWSLKVPEEEKDLFYKSIRSLIIAGTDNSKKNLEITKSMKLVPMYFYALFSCMEIDGLDGWVLNHTSLKNISDLIELATSGKESIKSNVTSEYMYEKLILEEPMAAAEKRILD